MVNTNQCSVPQLVASPSYENAWESYGCPNGSRAHIQELNWWSAHVEKPRCTGNLQPFPAQPLMQSNQNVLSSPKSGGFEDCMYAQFPCAMPPHLCHLEHYRPIACILPEALITIHVLDLTYLLQDLDLLEHQSSSWLGRNLRQQHVILSSLTAGERAEVPLSHFSFVHCHVS